MKLNKLLSILIAVFILVIIAEVVYLFQKSSGNFPLIAQKSATTDLVSTPTPTPYQNAAIDKAALDALKNLQVFKQGVLKDALLTYTVGGNILNIEDTIRKDKNGKEYQAKGIELQGDQNYTNTFFFGKESLQDILVQESSTAATISFDDLHINDRITIMYTINMLRTLGTNVDRVVITKF